MGRHDEPRDVDSRGNSLAPVAAVSGSSRSSTSLSFSVSSRFLPSIISGLLVLSVAIVYFAAVSNQFVNFDDDELVYQNHNLADGISTKTIIWAFTSDYASMWYPVTWFSYMLDYRCYGLAPWGYHLTNVLIHGVAVIVLFRALRNATGNIWASAVVAAVFASHPLQVETVAWVGERKGVLSGLFLTLTLAVYIWYARRRFSLARYSAVAAFLALGLMSKPALISAPALLLLLDYWPLGRFAIEKARETETPTSGILRTRFLRALCLLGEKVPLLLLTAGCVAMTIWSERNNIRPMAATPLSTRLANVMVSYATYIYRTLSFHDLSAFYPASNSTPPAWKIVASLAALSIISAIAIVSRRRCPAILVGWLWYLGTLLPVIGLVPIGMHGSADRYMYLPLIGLSVAIVWGTWQVVVGSRICERVLGGVWVVILVVLMVASRQQVSNWRDGETLWTHALTSTTDNYVAHCNLGIALAGQGKVELAISHFQEALALKPDYFVACYSLGNTMLQCGRNDDAIAFYQRTLDIEPKYAKAHNNLGLLLAAREQFDAAIAHYEKALNCDPSLQVARENLAVARAARSLATLAKCQEAVKANPIDAEAHYNLGRALLDCGRVDEGIAEYRKVLEIVPNLAEVHNNLGVVLAARNRFEEAIVEYQLTVKLKPELVEPRDNLAFALAKIGNIDEAILQYEMVLNMQPGNARALGDLAWIRAAHPDARFRDATQAVDLARRSVDLLPNDPTKLDALAAAYAEAGRFAEAILIAKQALELARMSNQPALLDSINKKIQLYKTNTPYREAPSSRP
jgi:tetratricopeptide (TPR) repeat protein